MARRTRRPASPARVRDLEASIERNPLTAVLIAMGAGLVDRIIEPRRQMNSLISQLAHEASAPLEEMLTRLIRIGALIAVATGCAIAASVFLTIDLYLYIESQWGRLIAAASIGGGYLVLALILLLVALRRPTRPPALDAAPTPVPQATVQQPFAAGSLGARAPAAAPPRNAFFAANIDAAVDPVIKLLRDAGLEKEIPTIEAGVQIAKQLNPLWLLAFGASAGVIVGRAVRSGKSPFPRFGVDL